MSGAIVRLEPVAVKNVLMATSRRTLQAKRKARRPAIEADGSHHAEYWCRARCIVPLRGNGNGRESKNKGARLKGEAAAAKPTDNSLPFARSARRRPNANKQNQQWLVGGGDGWVAAPRAGHSMLCPYEDGLGVLFVEFPAGWIHADVFARVPEIVFVANHVFVITALPNG